MLTAIYSRPALPYLKSIRVVALLFLILINSSAGDAAEKRSRHVGEIVFITGEVSLRLVNEQAFRAAQAKQELAVGDVIRTGQSGRASIIIDPETQLKIASNSTVVIKETGPGKEKSGALKTLLRLESGEVWTRSKGSGGLDIETPNATASIRGTEWSISVKGNESKVLVSEGQVQVSNEAGSVMVGKNEQGVVVGNQAPVKSIVINPRDRIQWTYYLSEKKLLRFIKFRNAAAGTAEALFNESRLDESEAAFNARLTQDQSDANALAGLGFIALKKGDAEKAGQLFERSAAAKETLAALMGRAYLLLSRNVLDDAAMELRHARQLFPQDPLPYIFQSYLYTSLGDYAAALRECDEGLEKIPGSPEILAFKADIYFILNKPEDAVRAIDQLLARTPDSSEGIEKTGFYHRYVTGDSKRSEDALRRAMQLDPRNDEAVSTLADLMREQGHIEEALQLIKQALDLSPSNAVHHYNYGRLLADINRIDEARAEFSRAVTLDPSFSRAYLGEGIVLLKEGRTEEALKELTKASMFEPNLSEIHSMLAIAHYQNHNVSAALDELKRAEECDPLDSTPHQLASTIYNDLFMPVEAIEESRKVKELLPYRKASGEALLESAKNGSMSLNYGLDFLDLAEWSLFYAQKALYVNPYSNTSHLGVALAYDKIGEVSALQGFNEYFGPASSEYLQGYILNVNSLNFSNRYRTLINKPGHYITFGGSYAAGDSESHGIDMTASGDFGSRFPLTYWASVSSDKDSGHLENSSYRSAGANIVLGYRPRYDHDLYLDIGYSKDRTGVTTKASQWLSWAAEYGFTPDDNQRVEDNLYWIQAGYHKRLGPESHILASARYLQSNTNLENPDGYTDPSGFLDMKSRIFNIAFGIKHVFTLLEDHQVSYGIDHSEVKLVSDEFWPILFPIWYETLKSAMYTRATNLHVYDRWSVTKDITIDAGLFFSHYKPYQYFGLEDVFLGMPLSFGMEASANKNRISPRIGVAINIGDRGVFRMAYQKRSTTGFLGEMAPVGAAGLVPPTFDIAFSEARDIQASIEYEIGKNTFIRVLGGHEKLSDVLQAGASQLWYARVGINQIIGKHLAASLRYHFNDSRVLDGSGHALYGIPQHSAEARLTYVHPSETYFTVRESYTGQRYADTDNTIRVKELFSTDLYLQKEFCKKKIMASVGVYNLFNRKYETADHPYYWYGGTLPGQGTTVAFRLEYRL